MIIVLSGLFGGFVKYLGLLEPYYSIVSSNETIQSYKLDLSDMIKDIGFWKTLLTGVLAAAVVPFFLNVISSSLLDFDTENISIKNYLIFVGLCLLASLHSDAFIDQAKSSLIEKHEKVQNQRIDNMEAIMGDVLANQSFPFQDLKTMAQAKEFLKINKEYKWLTEEDLKPVQE